MTVRELAAITLEARRLPAASSAGPQAAAFDRLGPLGTVLFILRPPGEPQRALFGVYERTDEEEWLEHALFGSPWPGVPTASLLTDLGLATSHIDGCDCFLYAGATAFADVVLEIEVDGERRSVDIEPSTSCFIAMGFCHPGVEHMLRARASHGGRLEEHAVSFPS